VKTKTYILAACFAAALAAPLSAGIITTGQCAGPARPRWITGARFRTWHISRRRYCNVSGVNNEGQTVFTGVLRAVYRSTVSNRLDFYYQYFNNASSLDSISQIQMERFGSFTTDVGFTFSRTLTARPLSAGKVNFSQTGTLQNPSEARGAEHRYRSVRLQHGDRPRMLSLGSLVIRTNATVYAAGTTTILNGASATYATFAPHC
jgi:hypothetical protein